MNFAELPPSTRWAALKHAGEAIAEVWFKPEGEPHALLFRIPRSAFDRLGPRLTAAALLKAVGLAPGEVDSWQHDGPPTGGLGDPLPLPEGERLTLAVALKPLPPDPLADRWQALRARWEAILGMEAGVETIRIGMEGLRSEMEGEASRGLTTDEKLNALNADVLAWNKLQSRLRHAIPKAKEFIHRATWAAGAQDRKDIEEVVEKHVKPGVPFDGMDRFSDQLDALLKDRQLLSAQGVTVQQECRSLLSEVQGALRTVQAGAARNAQQKRGATINKSKYF
ncbi:MAG: hypothetical protein K2W96_07740 [Gemmataceae bacterium]|nr:hypothetical protein [Gemmataceae bacterium]